MHRGCTPGWSPRYTTLPHSDGADAWFTPPDPHDDRRDTALLIVAILLVAFVAAFVWFSLGDSDPEPAGAPPGSGAGAPNQQPTTQLTIQWATTGAESVSIPIDSPSGTFESGLPATGFATVPAPCGDDANTYYVIAHSADGSTVTRSVTTQAFG